MIRDTVKHLKENGREVIYDAEHFFDGFKANKEYAISVCQAAVEAGVDMIALCDTNGGSLPFEIESIINELKEHFMSYSSCPMTAGVCSTCRMKEVFMMLSAIEMSFLFWRSRDWICWLID